MMMYYALAPNTDELEAVKATRPRCLLVSFPLWKNKCLQRDLIDRIGYKPDSILLDSGAVTFRKLYDGLYDIADGLDFLAVSPARVAKLIVHEAYNAHLYESDPRTPLHDYIKFIIKHHHLIDRCISLDRIGNGWLSEMSFKILEALKLNPLPVFGYGQPLEILEKLAKKHDYICLGGTAVKDIKPSEKVRWGLECLERVPGVKLHFLGCQNFRQVLNHLPGLYSADGGAWLQSATFTKNQKGLGKLEAAKANILRMEALAG